MSEKQILVKKAMMGVFVMLKKAQDDREVIKEIQTAIKKVKGE